ncbi:MAG: enoyl-CoA hydratase [Hyphomicrobiaceae bacterium]
MPQTTTATPATSRPASPLLVTRTGKATVFTLNRPEARNALSEAMLDALADALAAVAGDDATRVVVLSAAGSVFCAGHDLKELSARRTDADAGRAYFADIMSRCAGVMQAIVRLPKPVIAAVAGTATAAGCQLVASCDLAVAGQGARFCTPGVNIGLFCSTPMVALTRNMPRKRAMEMLLTGDMLEADAAADYGLVNRVVPDDRVLDEALAMARRIAGKPAATVAIGKEAFYRQLELPLAEAYAYASEVMVTNMLHADAREGIGAFLEKRQPDWER